MTHSAPFRSKAVTSHARGQQCTLRFPGACRGGVGTTVFAHVRDEHKGASLKASDHSGVFACVWCHDYLDVRHYTKPIMADVALYWHIIRGLQETWEILIADGIIGFPHDAPKKRKVPKPRLPQNKRQKLSGSSHWGPGRKLQSKNTLRKPERKTTDE